MAGERRDHRSRVCAYRETGMTSVERKGPYASPTVSNMQAAMASAGDFDP